MLGGAARQRNATNLKDAGFMGLIWARSGTGVNDGDYLAGSRTASGHVL